jgi:hypothetical protein
MSEKVDSHSAEQLADLKRLVTVPTLVSDGTLRAAIANLMGWEIDRSYYFDRGKPWAASYYADMCLKLRDELDRLEAEQ